MSIRKKIIISIVFLVAPASVALAQDYGDLRQEFESYKAPAYGGPESQGEAVLEPAMPELKLIEEKLEQEKKGWEAAIAGIAGRNAFFDFERPEIREIREAAKSEKIRELLAGEITPDILLALAFERNPGLEGAKKRWEASLENYTQATRLDNILSQYRAFIREANMGKGGMGEMGGVQKKFPFPGVVALKGDMAAKEVEMAGENYAVALRDMIAETRNAYDELVYAGDAVRISGQNLGLLRQLEKIARIQYDSGMAGYTDVLKAETRVRKLENDLSTWREYEKTVVAKVNKLLNLPPETPLGPRKEVEFREVSLSLPDLTDLGLEHSQELRLLRLEIEKANIAITMAEKEFFPDFTPGFSYEEGKRASLGETDMMEGGGPSARPVGGTPFWFGMNDAYVREARRMVQALHDELKSRQDKLRYDAKELWFRLDTAKRNVALYKKTLLSLAKNQLEAAQADYQSGKGDFLAVLDAQETWFDYNLYASEHARDRNQAVTNLERMVGMRLDGAGNPLWRNK